MNAFDRSRRRFLADSGAALVAGWAATNLPGVRAGAGACPPRRRRPSTYSVRVFHSGARRRCRRHDGRIWPTDVTVQDGSNHLLGTCRMGDDANASVVDRFHRAHDVPNLFVRDGSSLVTGGRGQPTSTIQALADRAADHIARFARAGQIPAGS